MLRYHACNTLNSIYIKWEYSIKCNIYYILIDNLKHNAKNNNEFKWIVINIILYVWMEIIDIVIFYDILSRLREIMIVGIKRMKRIGGVGECVIV